MTNNEELSHHPTHLSDSALNLVFRRNFSLGGTLECLEDRSAGCGYTVGSEVSVHNNPLVEEVQRDCIHKHSKV